MIYKNYYKILDLETSHVSLEEIKLAYRAAAKKYHPDVNVGDNLAEEKIKEFQHLKENMIEFGIHVLLRSKKHFLEKQKREQ